MKLTSELLFNYNAPDEFIAYFDSTFKDGIELDEFLQKEVPIKFLHFVVKYWKLTPAQQQLYLNKCNIQNSISIYNSINVLNSERVINSQNIANSTWIQNSDNVRDSSHIYNSLEINESNEIWRSKQVNNSNEIMSSHNITSSSQILQSENVTWSKIVDISSDVRESIAIYKSKNVENSFFCGFCENIANTLFCTNISNASYQLFNQPTNAVTFSRVLEELQSRLQNENFKFIYVDPSGYYPEQRYTASVRFDYMFNSLSPDFFGWIGTLPNFSEQVFLNLFFRKIPDSLS